MGMLVVVTSAEDTASMNIRSRLLEMAPWEDTGMNFDGHPVLGHGPYLMVRIEDIHIHRENLDRELEPEIGRPECLIFASRHRSQTGLRSLTVHPLGNYGSADFGGEDGLLVPTSPALMTCALLLLRKHASGLDFQVSFEVTHHGPRLDIPAFFIEIGSGPDAWPEPEPARAIARTILELPGGVDTDAMTVVGVGGGHYAPRHTDFVLRTRASMGHMVPNYAVEHLDGDMVSQIVEKTPGCRGLYFHKKAVKSPRRQEIEEMFAEMGVRRVRSADLVPRIESH